MKKQTKGKRTPPRRKPVRKSKVQGAPRGSSITQEMRDDMEAYNRAMLERMPPEIREEYLRLAACRSEVASVFACLGQSCVAGWR